ncbi:MAG: hormogonium polysaccharide biosynthesis protein HpsA [Synechococcales bacterium]|nr:hormogonium polysaccharide biosynthesis protein HpsA [Synechococcales bacterium]
MAKRRQRTNRRGLGAGLRWVRGLTKLRWVRGLSGLRWVRGLTKYLVLWLLRGLLLISRRPQPGEGFVLPTTILMLLVLSLSVGSITLRTYTRTQEISSDRQERVIFNAATPAIDRAKAKLEFLFASDPRFPNGIPSEDVIHDLLVDGSAVVSNVEDAYTFANQGEDRIDLDGDGDDTNDIAWKYRVDLDSDPTTGDANGYDGWVAYSIVFETPDTDDPPMTDSSNNGVATRASLLQIRNAPLSGSNQLTEACQLGDAAAGVTPIEGGWFEDRSNSSLLRKNFQVDVYVLPDNAGGTVSTVEFQQDRILRRGNKWGAWFRNDLEIFPGPRFNWNGAMHTEGSLIVGGNEFRGFLISAPSSCLYDTPDSSEITVTDVKANAGDAIPAFQGQMISGTVKHNSFGTVDTDYSHFHLFGNPPITSGDTDVRLDRDSDSVVDEANDPKPADYTLDPVALVTQGVSVARNISGGDPSTRRDTATWNGDKSFVDKYRIYNQSENPPYLDDFYRADNRYGPKPRYQNKLIPSSVTIGEAIAGNLMAADELTDEVLIKDDPTGNNTDYGLDGYWERRAQGEGLRLIVGQRLELGNAFGWQGNDDPLYPANACPGSRCHETLQRRTLRDNLAAVQSMAIYHASGDGAGSFPVACYALTAHPGTDQTIRDSRTYTNISADGTDRLKTNFLTGKGTNGWEFAPPASNDTAFATAIADDQPLGLALRNLAHFAGDPAGGTPSFPPVQEASGGDIHPYPHLTMWGDYSVLRRILAMLDGASAAQGNPLDDGNAGTDKDKLYTELSPADRSTLHTAACTLGMLGYNLNLYTNRIPNATLTQLGEALWDLVDGNSANGEVGSFPSGYVRTNDAADFYYGFTTEQYIQALKNKPNLTTDYPALTNIDELAELMVTELQIRRDRTLGFRPGWFRTPPTSTTTGFTSSFSWSLSTKRFTETLTADASLVLQTDCDPDIFDNTKITATSSNDRDEKKIGLALAFCSSAATVKYPSLYYLFPIVNHSHAGTTTSIGGINVNHTQPSAEEYVADTNYIFDSGAGVGVNDDYTYTVVQPSAIALSPKANTTNWLLPTGTAATGTMKLNEIEITRPNGQKVPVPFLDQGVYNGREMMATRVLDLNLDLMRGSDRSLDPDGDGTGNDRWLPNSGIIYAFREDAVREDGVVRPIGSGADWAKCGQNAVFEVTSTTNNGICRMEADPADPQDPPLDPQNLISPKAVDYYADPDRRPQGFRLKKGEKLHRELTNPRGLSFISDNPVYIQGSFNLHQTTTCNGENSCRLEEFQTKLNDNYDNFYSRSDLDLRFARAATDLWRPSEILADAVSIISDDFCDGSVEDSLRTAGTGNGATIADSEDRYGCSGNDDRTSYLNQNRPNTALASGESWRREGGSSSPIAISRNGHPIYINSSGNNTSYAEGNYYAFSDSKPLIGAQNERVNAIIISGLVPSRPNQAYGGLHNFPRFLSNWSTLHISGAFLQLNFSNYATAPFDQDAWETNTNTSNPELIRYYSPPARRWGYDVGLQYAPAGPIAERFISSESVRSEFYSEPPADDEYMVMLCRAIAQESDRDPDQTCAPSNVSVSETPPASETP